ncbi:3-dehydrosphinganine reductase [Sarracenia purpurea var. burkii]
MCVCGATNILADDLLLNEKLKDRINRILESNNSSTENAGSVYQVKSELVEENKRKPQLTSIIAASCTAMKADDVAKKALNDIISGSFIVPCNFEGFLLSVATAGLCPQRSYLMAFAEVIAASVLRVAEIPKVKQTADQGKVASSPQRTMEKGRMGKVPDASEATHDSMSVKEPASQGSAPLADEEVQ